MEIGLISDIHGDYGALQTVLDRLDNLHHVDQILCAGDLVGRGPEQNKVVDIIRDREIPTVRGNHDEWFYGVSSENSSYLKSLPIDLQLEVGGVDVFMCHGKPGSNLWGLYRDHVSDTLLNMMLRRMCSSPGIHTSQCIFVSIKASWSIRDRSSLLRVRERHRIPMGCCTCQTLHLTSTMSRQKRLNR